MIILIESANLYVYIFVITLEIKMGALYFCAKICPIVSKTQKTLTKSV